MREVETSVLKEDEVRVGIHATTVTAGDCERRTVKLPLLLGVPMRSYAGLLRPVRMTILGQEFAGEVESVGEKVTRFAVGDRMFGVPGFSLGGYAEYICVAESGSNEVLAAMPSNMRYEQAAAVHFGGMESLHFLRKAQVQSGEHVLVNGSGGRQVISATQSLSEIISSADIVVGAVGKPEFIKGKWIKTGAVVVDAGYHPGNVGDIELSAVIDKCAAYTPVPGGVGPMTIATLIAQTVAAAEKSV